LYHSIVTTTTVPGQPATSDQPTRAAILDAAERRFAERGYEGVSVREIAADAGLKNQASLYYHFASKQEIYDAALQRNVDAIIERLSGGPDTTAGPRDATLVARDLDRMLDYLIDHPHAARLIQRAGLDESALVRGAAQRAVQPLYELGVRLLAGAGGPWREDELPHAAAGLYHLIFGYFADAALLEGVLGEDLRSAAALARQRRFLKKAVARLLGAASDEGDTA
jgi:AcrR family transcriptional regulator